MSRHPTTTFSENLFFNYFAYLNLSRLLGKSILDVRTRFKHTCSFPAFVDADEKMGGHWQICCTAGFTGATEERKVNAKS